MEWAVANGILTGNGEGDLMREMRRQDSEYLQKIIQQNEEIIKQTQKI